jgi:hypothetical protein
LKVLENGVLVRKFGVKTAQVTIGCREIHNEELHNLYSSYYLGYQMIRERWVGFAAWILKTTRTVSRNIPIKQTTWKIIA